MQSFNVTLALAHNKMRLARAILYLALVILSAAGAHPSDASEFDSYGGVGSAEDPDFAGGYEFSLLGISVTNGEGTLQDGHHFRGVEIIEVISGSPAVSAGLKSQRRPVQTVMIVATAVASMAFAPAIMGLSMVDSIHLGESHEFIIAVDAIRVHDVSELAAALELDRPGETVYLTVVREGQRQQLRVSLFGNP